MYMCIGVEIAINPLYLGGDHVISVYIVPVYIIHVHVCVYISMYMYLYAWQCQHIIMHESIYTVHVYVCVLYYRRRQGSYYSLTDESLTATMTPVLRAAWTPDCLHNPLPSLRG